MNGISDGVDNGLGFGRRRVLVSMMSIFGIESHCAARSVQILFAFDPERLL